jgi:hypothetical protein
MREIRDKVISYERSLRDQRVDSHVSTANFAYNPVNEDFTDDMLSIYLSTKGWDLVQGQSRCSRNKKLATPTVLDTLKKKTKRAYNKRRNANANTLNTGVTATENVTDGTNVCVIIRFLDSSDFLPIVPFLKNKIIRSNRIL